MSQIRRATAAVVLTFVVALAAFGVAASPASAAAASPAAAAAAPTPVEPEPRATIMQANRNYVYTCGTVTCTVYFTINATRAISKYGWVAMAASGFFPSWVGKLVNVGASVFNYHARSATSASPDRCLHVKLQKYGGTQVIGVGTSHHTNTYCRSGN